MSIANQIFKEIQRLFDNQTHITNQLKDLNSSLSALTKKVSEIKTISDTDYALEKELLQNTENKEFKDLYSLESIKPDNQKVRNSSSTKESLKPETAAEYSTYIKSVCFNKKLYEEILNARNKGYSVEQLSSCFDNVPSEKRLQKTLSALVRSGFVIIEDNQYVYDLEGLEKYSVR